LIFAVNHISGFVQVLPRRRRDGKGRLCAVILLKELLYGATKNNPRPLIVERGGGAFEDADMMAEALEDGSIEKAAERAANLQGLILESNMKENCRLMHIA
jgi:hypothetical protein